jgi:transposase
VYGRKSEKLGPNQLLLFAREILTANETTPPPSPPPPGAAPAQAEPSPRKKNGHGRKALPASLPRKPVLHDLTPQERLCPECGTERVRIGEETREQLEYVPASLIALQHVRPKYACKACEGNVAIADRLPEPIEKGLPGPGLLAQVIVSKYADHLPLYRQERIFARQGVELSRQTTCDWTDVCADLLEPIWQAMYRRILQSLVIQTDDTPVRVQNPITGGMTTGRLWAYLGDCDHPFIVYDYTPDRSAEGPERILADFRAGYLQSDAYAAYDRIHARGILEVGCMAHARRKFDAASTSDQERSHAALAWIGLLYQIEREAKGAVEEEVAERVRSGPLDAATKRRLGDEITLGARQKRSRPLAEKFGEWLEQAAGQVLPKSPIGEAIAYARSNWMALTRFLRLDGLPVVGLRRRPPCLGWRVHPAVRPCSSRLSAPNGDTSKCRASGSNSRACIQPDGYDAYAELH